MQFFCDRPAGARLGVVSLGVALAGILSTALITPATVAQGESSGTGIVLPMTIEKVWYRAGQKKGLAGLRVYKATGDLTLTEEGLEFLSGKDSFTIPLANIQMVSMGKLGRDVDTDWAVVSLREGGLERIIAFKDGKALGYGQNTPRIFNSLRAVMKKLGAAHYNTPPGYRPYDVIDYQIALMVPEDWHVHIPSAITVGSVTPWGAHLFSSVELEGGKELAEGKAIRSRIADPASREFFLLREQAAPAMSCSGFKPKLLPGLLDRAAEDPLFEKGFELIEAPRSTPVTIAGCEGLHVLARGRRPDGVEAVVDLRLVAKRDTLFTFVVRSLATEYESLLEKVEPVVAAARFAFAAE